MNKGEVQKLFINTRIQQSKHGNNQNNLTLKQFSNQNNLAIQPQNNSTIKKASSRMERGF